MYEGVEELKEGLFVIKKEYVKSDGSKGIKHSIVHPIIKRVPGKFERGNINWKNFLTGGSWMHILIILCLLACAFAYYHDTEKCFDMMEHPCKYLDEYDCIPGSYDGEYDPVGSADWEQFGFDEEELSST